VSIVFLNRYFHPDHSATSQLLSDLAFGLSECGYDVRVITSRQLYDAPAERLPAHEIIAGVDVRRVQTSRFGRNNLVGRAVDYLTFYLAGAWKLWRLARRGDFVIAKTDPPLLSVIAAPIARWRGAQLINWLQDLFPEVAEVLGLNGRQPPGFVYDTLRNVRNQSLRSAIMNVVVGDGMAQKIAAIGVAPDRVCIIQNWADGVLIEPIAPADNPLRSEWGLDGKFVVGYSGNLGRAHDYRTLLDAILLVEDATRGLLQISWLFIGGGALRVDFAKELRWRGLKSVTFKPYQARDRLAQSLSAADVHVVCLRPELEGLIVPSKFYGIAAAGRPAIFVGDRSGEIAREIERNNIGYVVSQGDGAGLATRVLALARDPDLCRQIGAKARLVCEEEFEKQVAIGRWEQLLARIHPHGHAGPLR